MPNLNRVTIMGNLTRDPEIRFTPKGAAICEFGIAINRTWIGLLYTTDAADAMTCVN